MKKSILFFLLAFSINSFAQVSYPAFIPSGVFEFENMQFFKNNDCSLETIEPLSVNGKIVSWFYNYLCYSEKSKIPLQFGLRLNNKGKRDSPYLIIRWFPTTKLSDVDLIKTKEFLNELIGEQSNEVIELLKNFVLKELKNNRNKNIVPSSQSIQTGRYNFECNFTYGSPPRYPQLTLMIE